jgi:hypothetical protein
MTAIIVQPREYAEDCSRIHPKFRGMTMNKIFTTVCWFLFAFALFQGHFLQAQRIGYRDLPVSSNQQVEIALRVGEQLKFPPVWQENRALSAMQTLEAGFVLGNNSANDVEHGQVYLFDNIHKMTGVYLGVQTSGRVSGEVRIKVRQFGRLPGRLLGEVVWSLDSLADDVHWKHLTFESGIHYRGAVCVSLDVSGVKTGFVGLLSQRTDADQIWTKTAERKWQKQEILWKKTAVVAALWPVVQLRSDFAGGSGTREDPYQVATAEQLDAVRDYLSAHFVQIADIDLGMDPWSTGEGWVPIGGETPFTGSYDGGEYQISGLHIERPESDFQGLFGRTASARIRNLELDDASVAGREFVGMLVGQSLGGEMEAIQVTGRCEGQAGVGGIAGGIQDGWIRNSESDVAVIGQQRAGGIAGFGQCEGCLSRGSVQGDAGSFRLGGLLGEGHAMNSRSESAVMGGSEVGGLIGRGTAFGCQASGAVEGSGDFVGGLIGELSDADLESGGDEYSPGDGVPSDTTTNRVEIQVPGNNRVEIVLEDGTRFVFEGNGEPVQAEGARGPVDIDITVYAPEFVGLRPTGSMRSLKVNGAGDPSGIKPIISIPMAEIGTINPETVVVLRVGDLDVDGDVIENQGVILPVITLENEQLKFVDAVFPECVIPEEGVQQDSSARSETAWVGEVKYYLLSFDKALNWSKRPILERMVADTTAKDYGFRKRVRYLPKPEEAKIRKKPICNIVLLVHGHNEEEKDGFLGAKIASPWEFRYKRMVWDLIYERIGKNEGGGLPTECTAFYEFISPTYRPIFSPLQSKSGYVMKTLGQDLGELMNNEIMSNPQIKAMLDNDMPFNLYIVAHSQGGLVTRAGLRSMDERLLKNLKKVITWGTPHYGASLMSLRYALTVGHDIIIDGNRFPLQNIGQSNAYQSFVSGIALDAPGIRDMRWDWSKRELLRFGDLMRENTATLNEFVETELPYGRLFFSDNLKIFNETEGQNVSGLLRDKYMFYYATTPKNASLERGWFFLWRLWRFKAGSTPIEQGAQLNKLTMQDPHKDSDGAASIYSQRADGIYPGGGIQRRWFDDMDHEEFYGSEPPHRDGASLVKGRMVARETLTDLGMYGVRSGCATIRLDENTENDTLYLTGQLDYSIYQAANGGDDKPGKRILKIEGRFEEPSGDVLEVLTFTFKDDGTFEGKAPSELVPSLDTLYVTVILKDSSEVYFPLPSPGEALVHNVTKNKWYKTISKATERRECSDDDVILVYPGVFKEHVSIGSRNITLRSVKGPEETIIEGKDYEGTSYAGVTLSNKVIFEGFTVQNWEYGIEAYDGVIRIANNIVIGTEEKPGPGILVWKGSPIIENNTVHNCKGTGIGVQNVFNPEGHPKILGNTIYNNQVGIFVSEGHADIIGNNIYNNTTQQFDISPGVNTSYNVVQAIIKDNRIYGNTGTSKGGMNIDGNATIEGNLIENNKATSGTGGGISVHGSNKTRAIINNVIRNNTAAYQGGGILFQGDAAGTGEVINNVIEQNSAAYGGGLSGRPSQISGNQFISNTATNYGGAIFGRSMAWNATETVTVQGLPRLVNRHVPCFTETSNTYTGNTHGSMEGNWGPGIDNWCPDVGFNVYSN